MIKLNRFITPAIIFVVLTISFGCKTSQEHTKSFEERTSQERLSKNLLANMSDGTTDTHISEIYAEDISNVENLTSSKEIIIEYYDYDLNEDGIIDKIVTVRSPLHSSSNGDSLDFLIGTDSGIYRRVSNLVVQMYGQSYKENASMYILSDKTNGFHDIIIFDGKKQIILKYQNDHYSPTIQAQM